MKERPILFSSPMVRAILSGAKTQTRRVVKGQKALASGVTQFTGHLHAWVANDAAVLECAITSLRCPFGVPGDRLWVRESVQWREEEQAAFFIADGARTKIEAWGRKSTGMPSIHMPRGVSRITLEVTGVRVERLQDISEADAKAEGVERTNGHPVRGAVFGCGPTYREGFAQIWHDINGAESWAANPWVWCVEFRRVT